MKNIVRDPNNINSEIQQQVWEKKARENIEKLNTGNVDRRVGVYDDKEFHQLDIKWFPKVMDKAFQRIKVGQFRE